MDIGVWMAAGTLAHKLEARDENNPEQTWSLSRWPSRLSEQGEHRLFVASGGYWRGYFTLSKDALFTPDDTVPYALLFDTRTWTSISPTQAATRFRGFTYKVPSV